MRSRFMILTMALVLMAAGAAAWWLVTFPNPVVMDAQGVERIEVRVEPGSEDFGPMPEASTEDRTVVDAVVTILRSAQQTTDHKCGSRGVITLRQRGGKSTKLSFLPGHHIEWYEFRIGHEIYRVPRSEFLDVMKQVGLSLPTECR